MHLGRALPRASSEPYPEAWGGPPFTRLAAGSPPYSLLHQVGFALPPPSPGARCALTAPFHPCHARLSAPFGGLFSVALSCGSPRPVVDRHPALWCPDFPRQPRGRRVRPDGSGEADLTPTHGRGKRPGDCPGGGSPAAPSGSPWPSRHRRAPTRSCAPSAVAAIAPRSRTLTPPLLRAPPRAATLDRRASPAA